MLAKEIFSYLVIFAIATIVLVYFKKKEKDGKDWLYALYFTMVVAFGTVLHAMGLRYKQDKETTFSILYTVGRSLGLTLKMFGGDFNPSATEALARDSLVFQIAFFTNYMAAVLLTFLVAIKLFGRNLKNKFHVFRNSLRSKYIIIGYNRYSKMFLNNFDEKKKGRITIILDAEEKEEKKEIIDKGYAVLSVKDNKDDKEESESLMYGALRKAGLFNCKKKTVVLAMSAKDETNLCVARIITEYVKGIVNPKRAPNGDIADLDATQSALLAPINLSAHIMYTYIERAEHFTFVDYALGRVRFFNPYEVRARKFLLDYPITKLIPSEWINTEKARLKTPEESGRKKPYGVHNIFVGFGNANRELLKKSLCCNQLLGVDYSALVLDKNIEDGKKQLENNAEGLFFAYGKEYLEKIKESYKIRFEKFNALAVDFYEQIKREVGENDFTSVIIALGSDKLGIETALEVRQKLYEAGLLITDGRDRAKIFVKIRKDTVISDNLLNDPDNIQSEIITFGVDSEVMTEKYIIDEELDKIAVNIANNYEKNSKPLSDLVTAWDKLSLFKRDSNRYAAMSIETKLNLCGFKLTRCSECKTSPETAKAFRDMYGTERAMALRAARNREQEDNDEFVDFLERDADGKILDNARNNLARLEHQRWNTFHFINGWMPMPKNKIGAGKAGRQDAKAKQHACLTTFEGLDVLRELQVEAMLKEAENNGAPLSRGEALKKSDTVSYDFDLMDYVLENLEDSEYVVSFSPPVRP